MNLTTPVEWLISKASPNRTFFDAAAFPWVQALEKSYPEIKTELLSLLKEEPIPDFTALSEVQKNLISKEKWRVFIFRVYGKDITQNCELCPATAAALTKIPRMTGAMFSILAPRSHLKPHRGPYKGVLRCHLALLVPRDRAFCGIRVDKDVRHWAEGKAIIFDDTFDHEAWNNANELRVVLFIDFERPLPFWLAPINRLMICLIGFSPLVREILTNLKAARLRPKKRLAQEKTCANKVSPG